MNTEEVQITYYLPNKKLTLPKNIIYMDNLIYLGSQSPWLTKETLNESHVWKIRLIPGKSFKLKTWD